MQFYNIYGDLGYSSWEFPALVSGRAPMISDSDGKNFPWYGSRTEVCQIKGPQANYTRHEATMNDNFNPHITWNTPMSQDGDDDDPKGDVVRLTHVKRDQKFYTWLVAMDVLNRTLIVLRTYKWRMKLDIGVDPQKELGQRARLLGGSYQKQPCLVPNVSVPNCALYPPNANSSQVLVWRGANNTAKPIVVVTSKTFNHHHDRV
jgi:hypothetical protein